MDGNTQKKAGKEGTAKRPPTTPNKSETKKVKTGEMDTEPELSNTSLLMAIQASLQSLIERFDKQDKKLDDMTTIIKEHSESIAFNMTEIEECKKQTAEMKSAMAALTRENNELRERVKGVERYKRRWNLRINGLREREGENVRQDVINLLCRISPQLAPKMEEAVDTVHRLGRKFDNKPRQVIMQFVKRVDRDHVWRATNKHKICEELKIHFVEDMIKEDKLARDAVWPIIAKARKEGKKAGFN
uniref:Cytoplasmic dynein 2 heavy chain 1-like protein n=1 Tax=Knipowitschia caucasica TaxID=637954 RepID=A0AAV2MIN3_KNICA